MVQKKQAPPITVAQWHALGSWMDEYGDGWKAKLKVAWVRASAPAALHKLRNSHGPAWLDAYDTATVHTPIVDDQGRIVVA